MKVRGELRFSEEEGPRLFLEPSEIPLIEKTDIILGLTDNSEKITLYDCYLQEFGLIGPREYDFESRYLFWGIHFEDIPHFSRIDFQPDVLNQWVDINGFTHREDIKLNPGESAIFYKKPEDAKLGKWDSCTCYLIFKVIQISSGRPSRKQELKQEVYLRLDYEEDVVFIDIEHQTRALMSMLAFAANSPVYSNEMTGYTIATGEKPISIYSKQHIRGSSTREKEVAQFLFKFTDAHEYAPQFIEKWIDLSLGSLSPVTSHYIAEKYIPSGYIDRRFLTYARCLETYHRKTSDRRALTKKEFKERLEYICNRVDQEEIKTWVKSKLSYAYELTLKERLLEIVGKYRYNIGLFSDHAVKKFCKSVTDERNYQTHFEEKPSQRRMDLREMHGINDKMRKLIEICILTSMGFCQDFIDALFDYKIPFGYKIMALKDYIDSKTAKTDNERTELKKDAEYLLTHCSNGPYVILALCNRTDKESREKLMSNMIVLESIGMLKKVVDKKGMRYIFSEEYKEYVDEYYREKKKEEDEFRSTSKQKGREEWS